MSDYKLLSVNSFDSSVYTTENLLEDSKKLGGYLSNEKVSTDQVRRFLTALNKISLEARKNENTIKIKDDLLFLKPLLTYAHSRQEKLDYFDKCVTKAIDLISHLSDDKKIREQTIRLAKFTQSVIANWKE